VKVAVSGKGGVGKTTVAAMLAVALEARGQTVIALDADPDANLAAAFGLPPERHPTPLSDMPELAAQRTGAAGPGGFFQLNPKVDDIPETCAARAGGVRVLALGGVRQGGGGCICPATALVKALLAHLVLGREESVIMDMEAGIEHLGRATAQSMDALLVVVNDDPWSLQTARRIRRLAGDLGMRKLLAVANRLRPAADLKAIQAALEGLPLIGQIPDDPQVAAGVARVGPDGRLEPADGLTAHLPAVEGILRRLREELHRDPLPEKD